MGLNSSHLQEQYEAERIVTLSNYERKILEVVYDAAGTQEGEAVTDLKDLKFDREATHEIRSLKKKAMSCINI